MTRRLPIRWRLALATVALVLAALAVFGAVVIALERRSSEAELARQAELEARSLLAVAARADGGGASGLDPSTEPYLVRRSASGTLLAVRAPGRRAVINAEAARPLVPLLAGAPGGRALDVAGAGYIASIQRSAAGITAAAAVPTAALDQRIAGLLRALLIAAAAGSLLAAGAALAVARGALRPLTVVAERARRVSAGRLDQRVGPIGGHDEIAGVTAAIDAMLERLEDAFARQQRFVQDASHELRTPITIARGHLEVLDPRRDGADEVEAAVALAVGELDRMGRLVERLLALARAGRIPAEGRAALDVAALAAEAVERVRDEGERAFSVTTPDGPLRVRGDRDALVDVLVNLLGNAVRHTRPGGRVEVEARRDGDRVSIRVADDGDGIPADLLPHLFDRFTRADGARSRDAGGAGLGLAICRAYVEAHGGAISAASPPGGGAEFVVLLPAAS